MPDTVTRYVSGIPMEQVHWYEDPNSIAELYEWLATSGQQPLNVSHFIRKAHQWEAEYLQMRSYQRRHVSLEQLKACRDAKLGTGALTDGKVVKDDQPAA